jgi:hypothetical protein
MRKEDRLTNVVRVELVETPEGTGRSGLEDVAADGTKDGELSLVEVVDEGGVETDVGVDDERSAEDAVKDDMWGGGEGEGVDAMILEERRAETSERRTDGGRARDGLGELVDER